jgi:metal-responsive CopG/Arc/MetJ family transcriptional regulator
MKTPIALKLEPELLDQIDQLAASIGITTRTALITKWIKDGLRQSQQPTEKENKP